MEKSTLDDKTTKSTSVTLLFGVSIDLHKKEAQEVESSVLEDVSNITSESVSRRAVLPQNCTNTNRRKQDEVILQPTFLANIPKRRRLSLDKTVYPRNGKSGYVIDGKWTPYFEFFPTQNKPEQNQITVSPLKEEVDERNGRNFGPSARLELSDQQWKIQKVLKKSDINHLYRLILATKVVEENIFAFWDAAVVARTTSAQGVAVDVWDCDTETSHELNFKRWASNNSYIFGNNWKPQFVNRRGLKAGDRVGFFWDALNLRFNFTVLDRVRPASPN